MEPTSLPPYLSAEEAAQLLNIRKDTLYAYVSRGRLRSIEIPNQKARGYLRDDVERLQQAKTLRQQPEATVQKALHWGVPLLRTQISHLHAGTLYYRDQPLEKLTSLSLEDFLSHLWQKPAISETAHWEPLYRQVHKRKRTAFEQVQSIFPPGSTWFNKMQMLLPLWAVEDHEYISTYPLKTEQSGAEYVLLQCWQAVGLQVPAVHPMDSAAPLSSCFKALELSANAQDLMRMLLILSAEHELNLSSFTARCVASGQGNLYQSLIAAYAALNTPAHGGQVLKTQHFVRQGINTNLERFFQEHLSTGDPIPMPGHPLYPEGDPRWHVFKTYLKTDWAHHEHAMHLLDLAERSQTIQKTWPTLDWVLAIGAELLCPQWLNALDWFALGRMMGWLAHIQEQYSSPEMIRPRARWTPSATDSPQPED